METLHNPVAKYFEMWDNAKTYLEKEQIKHDIIWTLLDGNFISLDLHRGFIFSTANNQVVGSKNNGRPCLKFYQAKIVILTDRIMWYSIHRNEIIPENKVIVHKDGNIENNDIDNLILEDYSKHFVCSTREAELAFVEAIKEGKYTIDIEKGTLFNNATNNFIGRVSSSGAIEVGIRYKGRTRPVLLHRLVWSIANNRIIPDGLVINHIDGNKQNNNYKNLELVTHKGNVKHAVINNLRKATKNYNAKLTFEQAEQIRKLHKQHVKVKKLTKMFNVSDDVIRNIIHNKTYKYDVEQHNKTLEKLHDLTTDYISMTSFIENANPTMQYNTTNKLEYRDAEKIRSLYRNKINSIRELADMYKVSTTTIAKIVNDISYKYDPNTLNLLINSTDTNKTSIEPARYRKKKLITEVYLPKWLLAKDYYEREKIKYDIVQVLLNEKFIDIDYEKGTVRDTETNEYIGSANPNFGYISLFCKHKVIIPNAKIIWYSINNELIAEDDRLVHKNKNRFDDRLDNLEVLPMKEIARRGMISRNKNCEQKREQKIKFDYVCIPGEFEQYILDSVKAGLYKVDIKKGIFYGAKGEPVGCNHNNCVRVGINYKYKMRYISLGKVIWMVANNKLLPTEGLIIYKDGNVENTSIHNLELSQGTKPIQLDRNMLGPIGSNLTYEDMRIIKELYMKNPKHYTQTFLASMFNCTQPTISSILKKS